MPDSEWWMKIRLERDAALSPLEIYDRYMIGVNSSGARWIECRTCHTRSYNSNDVEQRYCAYCHTFHEDRIET